jgi:hypothetical protein
MARKEDESRVSLTVDGKQAINELGKFEMEAKELTIDMKNAKKGTHDYVNASKRLKEVRSQSEGLMAEIGRLQNDHDPAYQIPVGTTM